MHTRCTAILLVFCLLLPGLGLRAAPAQNRAGTYAVVLSAPPVGKRLSVRPRTPLAMRTHRPLASMPEIQELTAQVEQSQAPVRSAIQKMGLPVTGSTHHLLNAIFVRATPEQAEQLRALPGVRNVARMARYRLKLDAAAGLINAPAAWSALGGVSNAGAGITIGILDSGIDNTHPAFQDPSLPVPQGYPLGLTNYTNNKIIVAREYLSPSGAIDPTTSRPDDYTPRDRVGHGTFVAMIAAGETVTGPGGPAITGIAPKAYLGNYKIAGSTDINDGPSQDAVLMAMDDAVNDGMFIINLSLGSIALFGPNDQGSACSSNPAAVCDPVAEAVATATEQFGVIVTTPAGNDGDLGMVRPTLNTISSPGTAPDAITVGATTNSRQLTSTLQAGSGAPVPALFGNGPRPSSPLTATIRDVTDLGDDGTACSPLPGSSLGGMMVLVIRGNCDFSVKVQNAAAAGAIAVVVYNNPGSDQPIIMTGLVGAPIPAAMVGNSAGVALRSYIHSTSNPAVTLDPKLVAQPTTADVVADFSSRGPSIDLGAKPDLVAPGVNIYSATQSLDPNGALYDASRFTMLDGTSFAAPMAAGAAALVEQAVASNPNVFISDVISAVINTANPNVTDKGAPARETAMGAGKLNVAAAINPEATVFPSSISFGVISSTNPLPISGTLVVANIGSATDTFQLAVQQRDPDSKARVTLNGGSTTSIRLTSGQSANVTVALTGSTPSPGLYEGVITVKGTTGPASLRVVYHYAVESNQPASIFALDGDGLVGTAGQPLQDLLIFKLVDQFGLPVPNASVQFKVTQGSGSIVQADAATDVYGIAAASVKLGPEIGVQSFAATAGGLTVNFVDTARAQPSIGSGGVVNGASFASGQPVAPGSIISIFGANLADSTAGASKLPLSPALNHVSVSFDVPSANISVPGYFFYVSPGQLNVQVPWELAGQTTAMLKVRIDDVVSSVYQLSLSDSAPGIFQYSLGGQTLGVVTHADGSVVTPSNPAHANETVVVYATGVGPVDQPQASGEPAAAQPLANTKQTPTVTVAGQNASVFFSGLAPFFVGLNQINVTIPAGAPSGLQPLVITSNGVSSNTVNIPVQ